MGTCISAEKVITNSAEKKALNQLYGADVVDMESYWIGKVCRERGVPFLAVRAISDMVNQRVWDPGDLNGSMDRLIWHAISDLT